MEILPIGSAIAPASSFQMPFCLHCEDGLVEVCHQEELLAVTSVPLSGPAPESILDGRGCELREAGPLRGRIGCGDQPSFSGS